jgi:hypothetical protein
MSIHERDNELIWEEIGNTPIVSLDEQKDNLESVYNEYMKELARTLKLETERRGMTLEWGMGGVFAYNKNGEEMTYSPTFKKIIEKYKKYMPAFLRFTNRNSEWAIMSSLSTTNESYKKDNN